MNLHFNIMIHSSFILIFFILNCTLYDINIITLAFLCLLLKNILVYNCIILTEKTGMLSGIHKQENKQIHTNVHITPFTCCFASQKPFPLYEVPSPISIFTLSYSFLLQFFFSLGYFLQLELFSSLSYYCPSPPPHPSFTHACHLLPLNVIQILFFFLLSLGYMLFFNVRIHTYFYCVLLSS